MRFREIKSTSSEGRFPKIHPRVIDAHLKNGFKGPFPFSKMPANWQTALIDVEGIDPDSEVMITGNNPEEDEWIVRVLSNWGNYAYGEGDSYQIGSISQVVKGMEESGPSSNALCAKARKGIEIGASQEASCKSQGKLARSGNKSHKVGNKRVKVGGKKIKGKAHGGPLPDYS